MKILAFKKVDNGIVDYAGEELISCDIYWESCGVLDTKEIEVPVKSTEYTLDELQSLADKGLYRIAGYANRYTTRADRKVPMEVKSIKRIDSRFIECEFYTATFDQYETLSLEVPNKRGGHTVDEVQVIINNGIRMSSILGAFTPKSL